MAAIIPAMTSKPIRTGIITAAGETLFAFFLVDVLSTIERLVVLLVLGPSFKKIFKGKAHLIKDCFCYFT